MKIRSMLLLVLVSVSFASLRAQTGVQPFIGEIRYVGFNFAPVGWELCNGQTLSIAQNTALFALLGTTFGGNGQTTFNLPDMQGRVPVGMGNGAGLTPRPLGETGGQETVTLTVAEIPAHRHSLRASSTSADSSSPTGDTLANSSTAPVYSTQGPSVALARASVGDTGGGQPHENMQPFLNMTCIIAIQGIFPSRN